MTRISGSVFCLAAVIVMQFLLTPTKAQEINLEMPTTVEAWGKVFDKLDQGAPGDLIGAMALEMKKSFAKAIPQVPEAIKAKLGAGKALGVDELNQIGKIITTQTGEDFEPLTEDNPQFAMVQMMLQALGPRLVKTGGAGAGAVPNVAAQPLDKQLAQQWADLIHYIRVARFDLAVSNGEAILQASANPAALLKVVESSIYAKDYEKTLLRARYAKSSEQADLAKQLNEVAQKMLAMLEQAQKTVIRDPQRIRMAIERLDDGQRANINATRLLTEAAEFAAPLMVNVLLSREPVDVQLRPFVIEAMVAVGRPMVSPLSESLLNLPRIQRQQVAGVLGRIGYPLALPYLKAVLEQENLDQATAKSMKQAFDQIATGRQVPTEASAAQLFLSLAEGYYAEQPSLLLLPDESVNQMWIADETGRLSSLSIPTPIFMDVMSMRSARRALQRQNDYSEALSMWVMANFRRENRLPAGVTDPSYPQSMQSPQFYANLAGPRHLHPVLSRALDDRDAELALDAIAALTATTGYGTLLSGQEPTQPILRALAYPDRRVRFEAAFAIAQARPTEAFPGSGRIVPILASAVRQTEQPVLLAIGPNIDEANALAGRLRSAGGYDVLSGTDLDAMSDQLEHVPGVNLLVVQGDAAKVMKTLQLASQNVRLQATPLLAVADSQQAILINRAHPDDPMVSVVNANAEDAAFAQAIAAAMSAAGGDSLSADQAAAYAMRALELLRDAKLTGSPVLKVALAQGAMIEALRDARLPIAEAAGKVLALLDSAQAQSSLADVCLDQAADPLLRTNLLKSLAVNAKRYGSRLSDHQGRKLLELVGSSTGPLADAAAEAHGALNMPTDSGVQLIVK